LCGILLGGCLVLGIYTSVGHHAHFLMLLEELSTPSLNLKTLYKHNPTLRRISEYSFVILFACSRLGYGTYIWFQCALAAPNFIEKAYKIHDYTTIICTILQVGLCGILRILNIYWMHLIIKKIREVFKGKTAAIHSPKKIE
jgi:hypothetical protein